MDEGSDERKRRARNRRMEGNEGDTETRNRADDRNGDMPSTRPFDSSVFGTMETGVWGEETDEAMQHVLERSFFENQQISREDGQIQEVIRQSLASHVGETFVPSLNDFDDDIISIQMASLFESNSDEVAGETVELFDELKQRYIINRGNIPTVDMALDIVLARNKVEERNAIRDRKAEIEQDKADNNRAILDVEFEDAKAHLSSEIYVEARCIYDELIAKALNGGGNMPSVEFAVSLAQDREKKRKADFENDAQQEIGAKLKQEDDVEKEKLESRNSESREERAARFEAAAQRRKMQDNLS